VGQGDLRFAARCLAAIVRGEDLELDQPSARILRRVEDAGPRGDDVARV
jgi:hypothetical protein